MKQQKTVRILAILIIVALIFVVGGNAWLNHWAKLNTPKSFPQVEGELTLPGLDAPVDIYRDSMGVPYIYASTLHDLFMAQGYVHAQERFWQMDFWRHVGAGRLSEMFGKGQLDTDKFLRTLGWEKTSQEEWEALSDESKSILEAYTEGVNAYLEGRSGTEISLEYGVLKVLNSHYTPAPWTPVNSLTWGKAMAWDLRGNMGSEIQRAILLKSLTPEQVDELFPPYPKDHPVIVPTIGENVSAPSSDDIEAAALPALPALEEVADTFAALDVLLGPVGEGIGSNSWAVAGSRTDTGMPYLANDPHLGSQMPSIWFQMNLFCEPVSDACPYQVGGFSFAGVPGIIIGHNDHVAWGFTNVGPDVMDLYIEKVNPENPNQYEYKGEWLDFDTRTETIDLGNGKTEEITIRETVHGPVISDVYGPLKDEDLEKGKEPFREQAGIDLPENYVIALKWTALEPGSVFEAIWGFDKASNWEEFREAAKSFYVPAQNLLYADTEGNIGYQMPGKVPIRAKGDGRYPVPGWTGEYDWTGYIPFEELPYVFNPQSGYIVTANNQVPPWDYPYLVTTDWAYGYRAQRIVDMILAASGPIDISYIQTMQGDDKNLNAETLVPVLLQVHLDDPALVEVRNILKGWDYQQTMDSPEAALFEVFWKNLLLDTFSDDLPEDYLPSNGSRWYEVMRSLVQEPHNAFWDDKETKDIVETRDDIFARAFEDAVKEIRKELGKDPAQWRWGALHTVTFENQTLGKSGIPPIENLFNRGPFETSGGSSIVNATGWSATKGYKVNWLPSMRMIVDLSDLNQSLTVHTTGESGHAGHPHYIDMANLWRNIEYYPMYWNEGDVTTNAESHLRLTP